MPRHILLPVIQSMRSEPIGVARSACFEELAGVFAGSGALHYAKILASLKIKNGISDIIGLNVKGKIP